MLESDRVGARYGGIEALSGVELMVKRGEIVCLLGANGAGKSTLLGAIMASVSALVTGSIRLDGRELLGLRTDAIVRAGVALSPERRQLFGELTVEENLAMGAYLRRDPSEVARDLSAVWELFPRLLDRRRQLAATMSGGEQQMVAIGRALMSRPRLLLLDEPSLGLAPLLVTEIMGLIQKINAAGTTVLLVEQNARQALRIAHRAYILEKGRIVGSGRADQLLGDDQVVSAYLGGPAKSREQC
jgi:branched-chain amino acid transport system ATP-binding protein